jgi:hypothetical protein
MRSLAIIVLGLVAATGAAAQDLRPTPLQNELDQQQQLERQRAIAQQNELTALELQLRTEQNLANLERQAHPPPLSAIRERTTGGGEAQAPPIDAGQLAAIPDDRLAASDARVRAAARNR